MLEMDKTKSNVRTCKEMLLEFKNLKNRDISSKLLFDGIENEDVYNITAPFLFEGKRYLAGRVEKRTEEWSRVVFFMEENEKWIADNSIPSLPLQDPFVTQVNGEFIVGGVTTKELDKVAEEFIRDNVVWKYLMMLKIQEC